MNTTTYPQTTTRKCHKCGNFLILVAKTTDQVEGQYFPVTTSIFQCSDVACDENTKKETVQRIQLLKDQETAKKKRLDNIRANRLKNMAAKS